MKDLKAILDGVASWTWSAANRPFEIMLQTHEGEMDQLLADLSEHEIYPQGRKLHKQNDFSSFCPGQVLERVICDNGSSLRIAEALGVSYSKGEEALNLSKTTFPAYVVSDPSEFDDFLGLSDEEKHNTVYMGELRFPDGDMQQVYQAGVST